MVLADPYPLGEAVGGGEPGNRLRADGLKPFVPDNGG